MPATQISATLRRGSIVFAAAGLAIAVLKGSPLVSPADPPIEPVKAHPVALSRPAERAPEPHSPEDAERSDSTSNARIVQLLASRYRLAAERSGAAHFRLPARLNRLDVHAAAIAAAEERLFGSRRAAFEEKLKDLRARITVTLTEIDAFSRQRSAKEEEAGLLREELKIVEGMHSRQLANVPRLLNLKRDITRAEWDMASVDAAIARSRLAIRELEQDINQARHDFAVDADREIRDLDTELASLTSSPRAPRTLLGMVRDAQKSEPRRTLIRAAEY